VSVDKKIISPHNEWYIENVLVCAHFFKTSTWYLMVMLFCAVICTSRDSLEFIPS